MPENFLILRWQRAITGIAIECNQYSVENLILLIREKSVILSFSMIDTYIEKRSFILNSTRADWTAKAILQIRLNGGQTEKDTLSISRTN